MRSHCHNFATDQSLRGQLSRERLPTGFPFRYYDVLESVAYEEGFPVISRFIHQNHFWLGQFNYPTRNFATLGRL